MVAQQDIRFSCNCGQLSGHLADASPQTTVRARCFCSTCRAAEVYHDQPDPGENGVDLVMVDPAKLSFDQGREHVAAIRIFPKGPLRWYAACCGARLFNTAGSARFVFITVSADRIAESERLGPEQARAFVKQSNGKRKHEHGGRLFLPMLGRSLSRFVTGRWRDNPLFDPQTGKPIAKPQILTREERAAIGLPSKASAS